MYFSPQQDIKTYTCVGVMSGTSLDGLDICLCSFTRSNSGKWNYSILKADTLPYTKEFKHKLEVAPTLNGEQLTHLDYEYGHLIGKSVNAFLANYKVAPAFVASHGHTVFHNPQQGYTLQIGKGPAIAAETGIPCISDFRSSDICLGGQGAPLVPIGDELLFTEYDICLNLGGIANLSYQNCNSQRIAYDIAPCNMLLNHLANSLGYEFDKNGEIGHQGKIDKPLLSALNSLDYYKTNNPKSLGREWFEGNVLKLLQESSSSTQDKLRTSYEHIAQQIANVTNGIAGVTLLLTGGGAKNIFLTNLIKEKSSKTAIVPDTLTIDFKEALIFAFLGVLYMEKEVGALNSVTGAKKSSIGGCMYY